MARLSCFVVLLATVAIVSATNWAGTWTANNRYGGVMYSCVRGERWYATFSSGGFANGRIINGGETVEGNWWEGGRGNRNYLQGSFRITLSADGQRFDGLWNRLETEHSQRWHENRLGAPHPDTPTSEQCLAPVRERLTGTFFGGPEGDTSPGQYKICRDNLGQIYGSFHSPLGFLEGWSVDDSTGFHGYRYTNDGLSGAYILRSTSENEVRGWFWLGRLARENIKTAREEVLTRTSFTAKREDCEEVGPGFLTRHRGPSAASSIGASIALLVAVVGAVVMLAL